jgi:fructose-bisphosphate aldolase class I
MATENLDMINKIGNFPWNITYSYGRALQAAALAAWGGKKENIGAASKAFTHRAKMNALATQGKWSKQQEG